MRNQVLVVDDDLSAAKTYASYISLKCKIEAIPTDNPDEAIKIVKSQPIKVVVLDQKMPQKKGTELFEDLIRIEPKLKAIMLSGEAEPEEVGKAFNMGYIDYIHKSKVKELPDKVFVQYTRYCIDELREAETMELYQFYKESPLRGIFKHSIKFYLHSYNIISQEYIFKDSWKTIKQINSGEEIEFKDKIDISQKYIHEETNRSELISKFSFTPAILDKLTANLEVKLSSEVKNQVISSTNTVMEFNRKYKLPAEPVNPKELYTVSRHYQRAKVYKQIRCLILKKCECCQMKQIFPIIMFQLTDKIATKQKDFFSDKTTRELETGIENIR